MEYANEVITRLGEDLERYDKVFLLREPEKERKVTSLSIESETDRKEEWFQLVAALCRPEMLGFKGQRVLLLSDVGTGSRISRISEKGFGEHLMEYAGEETHRDDRRGFVEYRMIQEKEADFLLHLYHMYEFSDRFYVISCEDRYGSLFHFLNIGLLTIKEAAKAFLY